MTINKNTTNKPGHNKLKEMTSLNITNLEIISMNINKHMTNKPEYNKLRKLRKLQS